MKRDEAHAMREDLMIRLKYEGAEDLAEKLAHCGQKVGLTCTHCGIRKTVLSRCKRKWCPACQRSIAAKRAQRMRGAVRAMEYPLFVTLTMTNSDDPESVRHLRRSFGKLRNRKLWKDTVQGGCAAVEVTNKGNGWHPHLHALVDCRWLAIQTPEPPRNIPNERKRLYYESARRELSDTWAHTLGQPSAIVLAKRAHGVEVVKEVLKYSIKGSELLDSPDEIAPMLRVLENTRLITTFGTLYGRTKELDNSEESAGCPCGECGAVGSMLPDEIISYITRAA